MPVSVSTSVNVDIHPILGQVELLTDGVDDPQVGLVGDKPCDVIRAEVVFFHDLSSHSIF